MRAPHLTPPCALALPGGLVAEYVPQSDPPAYRVDAIGCDLPVDAQIPEDLERAAAATMPDGRRPYGWWKLYQRSLTAVGELNAAELAKDAAKVAKVYEEID
jgi:hypothetical protein